MSPIEMSQHFCNTRVIYILCPHIIVELYCDDQRNHESGSLPQTVGDYAVHYVCIYILTLLKQVPSLAALS